MISNYRSMKINIGLHGIKPSAAGDTAIRGKDVKHICRSHIWQAISAFASRKRATSRNI